MLNFVLWCVAYYVFGFVVAVVEHAFFLGDEECHNFSVTALFWPFIVAIHMFTSYDMLCNKLGLWFSARLRKVFKK